MTEEIIIDGVDVAGCKHYDYCTTNECHIDFFRKCEGEDCYYKQLKRLEQENKELKKANDRIVAECAEIMKPKCETSMISELMKENKDLKNEINKLGKKHEDYCNTMYWQMKEQMDNYRSALEEIREIAKFAQCLPCGSGNLEDCLNCNDDITNNGQFCMEKRIHEIKTKCVEVLNEK